MSDIPVVFDYAVDCTVWNPRDLNTSAANNAQWTGNSVRCGLYGYGQFIQQGSWDIAAGAVKPHVNFIGTEFVDDGLRGVINQPVEGMTIYNPSDGNLNIYNGSSWVLPDGTST